MDYHAPVLEQEILSLAREYINPQEEELLFVDATLGDAGHSLSLLRSFPRIKLLAFDRDSAMLSRAKERLSQSPLPLFLEEMEVTAATKEKQLRNFFYPLRLLKPSLKGETNLTSKVLLCHASYHHLAPFLREQKLEPKLILLDLGVSLFHLKGAGRGFSYMDKTLDMRFDPRSGISAKDIINHYPPQKLTQLFREFGEEPFARPLAKMIVKERPFHSAHELSEKIRKALPKESRAKRIHPATRSFQALRIAVNQELDILQRSLRELPQRLAPGGLLIIISFHSLEDRIVKLAFKEIGILEKKKAAKGAAFLILKQRPLRPSLKEIEENPAARSACLRALLAQRGT